MEVARSGPGYNLKLETGINENTSSIKSMEGQNLVTQQMKFDTDKLIELGNKVLTHNQTGLKFVKHDRLNEYFIQVINENEEVVREIPSEKSLDFFAAFIEFNHIFNMKV